MQLNVNPQFEPKTSTWQYIVACPETRQAAIIDPVLDYDQATLSINTTTAHSLLDKVNSLGYKVVRLLETHAHADHPSASHFLQKTLVAAGEPKPPICIGRRIRSVQENFGRRYGIPEEEMKNAFDQLWEDDEKFNIGNLTAQVLHLPGHTPDHIGYLIGDNVFTGDSIFNPDVGTARCDFPGGDANALWSSIQRLLSLPDQTKVYTGHDYPPGRDAMPCVTVAEQKQNNKHVKHGTNKDEYIKWRVERDGTLNEPKLIHPSVARIIEMHMPSNKRIAVVAFISTFVYRLFPGSEVPAAHRRSFLLTPVYRIPPKIPPSKALRPDCTPVPT